MVKTNLFNDEEQRIVNDLEGLSTAEKIRTLEDSLTEEPTDSGRSVLRSLILKLEHGQGKVGG